MAEEPRVAGSGGCKRLVGGFSLEGETLRFSQIASTQMACGLEVMDLERRYTAALERVRRWSIDRCSLLLQDAGGRTLLLFLAADGPAQNMMRPAWAAWAAVKMPECPQARWVVIRVGHGRCHRCRRGC